MLRRARASFIDKSGMLFVDCAECAIGRCGEKSEKKSTMNQLKNKTSKSSRRGCFGGYLRPDLFIRNFS